MSANVPISESSARARNDGRCPPASKPVATIAETPASSSARASATEVAAPIVTMSRARHASSTAAEGIPKTKLKTGGRASSSASIWSA